MEAGPEGGAVGARFAMHPAVVAALGGVAAVLAAIAWTEAGAGRVMFGVAALLVAAECLRGATLRPTVETTEEGVRVAHGFWQRELLAWDELDTAEMRRRSRRGTTAKWLELDTGERLVTVPGYRLGTTVGDVLAAIETARGTAEPPGAS